MQQQQHFTLNVDLQSNAFAQQLQRVPAGSRAGASAGESSEPFKSGLKRPLLLSSASGDAATGTVAAAAAAGSSMRCSTNATLSEVVRYACCTYGLRWNILARGGHSLAATTAVPAMARRRRRCVTIRRNSRRRTQQWRRPRGRGAGCRGRCRRRWS